MEYVVIMTIVKQWYENKIITEEEMLKINEEMKLKYKPLVDLCM